MHTRIDVFFNVLALPANLQNQQKGTHVNDMALFAGQVAEE
jgi:hypothetical protein